MKHEHLCWLAKLITYCNCFAFKSIFFFNIVSPLDNNVVLYNVILRGNIMKIDHKKFSIFFNKPKQLSFCCSKGKGTQLVILELFKTYIFQYIFFVHQLIRIILRIIKRCINKIQLTEIYIYSLSFHSSEH